MIDILKYITLPQDLVQKIWIGTTSSCDIWINPERSGLLTRIKSYTDKDWLHYYHQLHDEFSYLAGEERTFSDEAYNARNWEGLSISKLLKMHLSYDPNFVVTRDDRNALTVYEKIIYRDGAVHGSAGHTALPTTAFLDLIAAPSDMDFATIDKEEIDSEAVAKLRYTRDQAINLLKEFKEGGLIDFLAREQNKYFSIYVPKHMSAEKYLIDYLMKPSIIIDKDAMISLELDADQSTALRNILSSENTGYILAGFPGAGKTYTCRKFVEYIGSENFLALATTGVAVQVLEGQLPSNVETRTISSAFFQLRNHKLAMSLKRKYFIVDECSMLNMQFVEQLNTLLEVLQPLKVILTGDPKQLPPVGCGAIFECLVSQSYGTIPVSLLTVQHRMDPSALKFLAQLESRVTWDKALQPPTSYDGVRYPVNLFLPRSSFTETADTHGVQTWSLLEIYKYCMVVCQPKLKDFIKLETRRFHSTYTKAYAYILNVLIESVRVGYDPKEFLDTIALYYAMSNDQDLFESHRIKKANIHQQRKYINNFLQDRIADKQQHKYKDNIEDMESTLQTHFGDMRRQISINSFIPGAMVRCSKNLWLSKMDPKKKEREQLDNGIRYNNSLTNGQVFIVQENGQLLHQESNTTLTIINGAIASKFLKTCWVSTVHKLQGAQAESSVYFHTPNAESKLLNVALSRGRKKNFLVDTPGVMSWQAPDHIIMKKSVHRLSAYAEYLRQEAYENTTV